jgi:polyisoprenoid-binding protein YceI
MKLVRNSFIALALVLTAISYASADDYVIDTHGGHASINAKYKHIGISWLVGRFETFSGTFSYDPDNLAASSVNVEIDVTSLNSNHAERDVHLTGGRYLDASNHPQSTFNSTRAVDTGNGNLTVYGDLSLHGVTKEVAIEASAVGSGDDPWGGYRVGLEGTTTLDLRDFGYESFGPTHMVELSLYLEGVKQ